MRLQKPCTKVSSRCWGVVAAVAGSLCFVLAEPALGSASRSVVRAKPKQIAKISSQQESPPGSALIAQARALYGKGQLRDAIAKYSKVDANSPLWPEAYEEKAWAHARLGEYPVALNHVKALTEPPLVKQSTLEPFLLGAMIRMKTCQYDEMYRLIHGFKTEAKQRLAELEATSVHKKASELWAQAVRQGNGIGAAGAAIDAVVQRDQKLKQLYFELPRHFERDRIVNRSKTERELTTRLVALARKETRDIENVARKLSLVETEAASRMLLAKPSRTLRSEESSDRNSTDGSDILKFPDDPEDIWIDEVGLSRHQFDGCEQPGEKPSSESRFAVEQSSRKSKRAGDL